MIAQLKRIALVIPLLSMGACTMTPIDLIAPAGLLLMRGAMSEGGGGPISVDTLLSRVRGDGPAEDATELDTAKLEAQLEAASQKPTKPGRAVSVEAMLAQARNVEPADNDPQIANDDAMTLDDLRRQVLDADQGDLEGRACK